MTRHWIGRLLLTGFAYCMPALIGAAHAACDRPIVWAWNQFPPYAYLAPSGDLKGLDVEIVERVLKEIGCTGTPVELPAKRALAELERGDVDLVAAASVTPEREVYGRFSIRYRDERVAVFMLADNPMRAQLKSAADLYTVRPRLVANLGGFYGDDFAAYEKATSEAALVSRSPSIEDRFRLVDGGRTDGLIEDDIAGADMVRRLGLQNKLAVAPIVLSEAPVYLLTSKASITPDQLAEVNKAIEKLRESGELDRIIASYRLPTN
jgi:polar amino acid transport system substrate-binding protein